ncbi:hypothetical protein [Rudanella lutea]|uniref:hypothetical protein n=1 Tax=Rudanella lutea TaxID=451374 RepID=UPI000360283F|nr:hypothetical protein [Rudanella lutea]
MRLFYPYLLLLLAGLASCKPSVETFYPIGTTPPGSTTGGGSVTQPGGGSTSTGTTPPQTGQPPINVPGGGGGNSGSGWTSVFNPNLPAPPAAPGVPRLVILSNAKVRVGVDLVAGGAITFLTDGPRGTNMINNFDLGRQLQTSLYSGPIPYVQNGKQPAFVWRNLGWNPVQTGDMHNNPAQVIGYQQLDSNRIYVKTIPLVWPLFNEPAECVMEHWLTLRDNVVHVRSRTQVNRRDTTQYEARAQEVPCAYLNAPLNQIVTYTGAQPFTNAPVVNLSAEKDMAVRQATENWTALLDKNGRGLGLHVPNQFRFVTGFLGSSSTGTEFDDPTSYQAATPLVVMDHNTVYEYEYNLIIGTVTDIRAFVYAQPRPETKPNFRFTNSRQGWHYYNTTDAGWPIQNELVVRWSRADLSKSAFSLKSPRVFWRAADLNKIYVQAAFTTAARTARFNWLKPGDGDFVGTPDRVVDFPIIGDGQMRTYEIDLTNRSGWDGLIYQIQLEATPGQEGPNDKIRLRSVTAERP